MDNTTAAFMYLGLFVIFLIWHAVSSARYRRYHAAMRREIAWWEFQERQRNKHYHATPEAFMTDGDE